MSRTRNEAKEDDVEKRVDDTVERSEGNTVEASAEFDDDSGRDLEVGDPQPGEEPDGEPGEEPDGDADEGGEEPEENKEVKAKPVSRGKGEGKKLTKKQLAAALKQADFSIPAESKQTGGVPEALMFDADTKPTPDLILKKMREAAEQAKEAGKYAAVIAAAPHSETRANGRRVIRYN